MIIMNIENLVVGTTYKNWRVLCEALGVESKTGNSKPAQKKNLLDTFHVRNRGKKSRLQRYMKNQKKKLMVEKSMVRVETHLKP